MLDGENKLISLSIRGEASAFGSLYDHYQPKIYRFVLIKVSRREEAEDLTHQVFLNAWQNIASYEPRGFPFSSWLYRIARNLVVDYYRTRKSDLSLDEIDPEYFAHHALSDTALDNAFTLDRVRQAIQKLKPEYQDVIIMRFVEDFSIKEIAATLDKSEGAVKLIQHRAVQQLKRIVHES